MERYKKKYLKYKIKYHNALKLFNQNKPIQLGGYMLSDEHSDFLLGTILSIIKPNSQFFDFKDQTHKIKDFNETLNYLQNDAKYNSIITYLLKIYNDNISYKQYFKKKDGTVIFQSDKDIFPYHINFGALMFLSFITEMEIFTLFHSFIGYNTTTNQHENSIASAFCGHNIDICPLLHIYKTTVNEHISDRLKIFTNVLDDIFNKFMKILVMNMITSFNSVCGADYVKYDSILQCIVPIEDYRHVNDTFDFIYVDWKNRIEKMIDPSTINIRSAMNIIDRINDIIKASINEVELKTTSYIADGLGFFSFIFLNFPEKSDIYYGSCLTASMFEFYLMSRLHTNAENMTLLVEKNPTQLTPHPYWKITQTKTQIPILTHFATKFTLSGNTIILRSLFTNPVSEINYKTDKTRILKLLIYLAYDMFIQYVTNSSAKSELIVYKDKIEKILLFIKTRIEKIENFYLYKLTNKEITDFLTVESFNINFPNSKLTYVLRQDNAISAVLSMDITKLISDALINNNYTLVQKLISFIPELHSKIPNILETILTNKYIDDSNSHQVLNIIKNFKMNGWSIRPGFVFPKINNNYRRAVNKILGQEIDEVEATFSIYCLFKNNTIIEQAKVKELSDLTYTLDIINIPQSIVHLKEYIRDLFNLMIYNSREIWPKIYINTNTYNFINNEYIKGIIFHRVVMKKGMYYYILQQSDRGIRFLLYAIDRVNHSEDVLSMGMPSPDIQVQLPLIKDALKKNINVIKNDLGITHDALMKLINTNTLYFI